MPSDSWSFSIRPVSCYPYASGLAAYMRMIFKDQFIHGVGGLRFRHILAHGDLGFNRSTSRDGLHVCVVFVYII